MRSPSSSTASTRILAVWPALISGRVARDVDDPGGLVREIPCQGLLVRLDQEIPELPLGLGVDLDPVHPGRDVAGEPAHLAERLPHDLPPLGVVEDRERPGRIDRERELPPVGPDRDLPPGNHPDVGDLHPAPGGEDRPVGPLAHVEEGLPVFSALPLPHLLILLVQELHRAVDLLPFQPAGFHDHPAERHVHPLLLAGPDLHVRDLDHVVRKDLHPVDPLPELPALRPAGPQVVRRRPVRRARRRRGRTRSRARLCPSPPAP